MVTIVGSDRRCRSAPRAHSRTWSTPSAAASTSPRASCTSPRPRTCRPARSGSDSASPGSSRSPPAVFLVLLPPTTSVPAAGGPGGSPCGPSPNLAVTALDGVMSIQFKVLTVALPLWPVAFTAGVPAWVAGTLMLTAVVIHATGELRHSAALLRPRPGPRHRPVPRRLRPRPRPRRNTRPRPAPRPHHHLGPTRLVRHGALFTLTGLAVRLAVRRAERHRPHQTPLATGARSPLDE